MYLVICSATDLPALWAYRGLKARGLAPLELIHAETLARSLRFEHRLGAAGVDIRIALPDGRTIGNHTIHGVLNRLAWLQLDQLPWVDSDDRDYATQELTAFFLSWLHAVSRPVVNRATPQGLAGQWRHGSEWVSLAARAGLPTQSYRQTSRDSGDAWEWPNKPLAAQTVLVIADRTFGAPAPAALLRGCLGLARLAETELLGIDFAVSEEGSWSFAGATALPDLRLGGEALLDILASLFVRRALS
jgi:hypothetical protein